MIDDFGDRMKAYEALANPPLLSPLPVCARLDGRGFHAFTKHAERPFSASFHRRMVDLTRFLVVESCADVGYTQSDEISLAVASSL
jgi:tRNA(His) 5'-end guanylyltransferase